jgi:hypothetical protein
VSDQNSAWIPIDWRNRIGNPETQKNQFGLLSAGGLLAMVAFAQLHAQNHKITELSNVFLYLVRERPMCDTDVACNVFFDLTHLIREHMELVDRELCGRLISHPDQLVRNTSDRFLSGRVGLLG